MKRPRVGFTFGTKNPAWQTRKDPYLEALWSVGVDPVLVLPESAREAGEFSGWVIGGGTDIDPALYGEPPHEANEEPDAPRDALEAGILRAVLALELPMLAICRGMQMLNVVQGGSLAQHIEGHRVPGVHDAHEVRLEAGARLGDVAGSAGFAVNSRHHQAVARLGRNLRIAGYALDGTVEALEYGRGRFAFAVQWHPEDRVATSAEDRRLFETFADTCDGGTIRAKEGRHEPGR